MDIIRREVMVDGGVIMSWDHTYYIGYKDKETGLIKPFGPFDDKGGYKCVLTRSRSFASNLYEDFYVAKRSDLSPEFKTAVFGEGYSDSNDYGLLKILPIKELPKGDYIKSGYFLLKDIEEYLANKDEYSISDLGIFYERLTPEIYGLRLANELAFKDFPSEESVADEDDEFSEIKYSCKDYAFFAYPDYSCKEYECSLIRDAVHMLRRYDDDIDIVIVEIEG